MTPTVHTATGSAVPRLASMAIAAVAAGLLALLVPRVLAMLADASSGETLARALPGVLGGVVTKLAEAPGLVAALAAMLPPVLWTAALLAGALAGSDPGVLHRGLALAWTMSVLVSAAAIVFPPVDLKQGLAAVGYALAWPALLSAAAVLWSSRISRVLAHGILLALTLAGLVVRLLPLGWPGEHSLTWWAMLPAVPRANLATAFAGWGVATALALLVITRARRWSPALALPALSIASLLLLRALPAFEHYGPAKHPAVLASEINTSYFQAADSVRGARAFVRDHARRMPTFAMHARTHPPLWPLVFHAASRAGAAPLAGRVSGTVARVLGAGPREAAELASSVALRPLTLAETNGLWLLVGALALAVLALPWLVWFVARARVESAVALRAAALAALLPAPLLYFPDVDVLHPALYALAAGAWLRRGRGIAWPLLAGVVAAILAAFSFGNLALFAWFAVVAALEARPPGATRRSELLAGLLVLLPLAALVAAAAMAGARPFAMLETGLAQHREILAHRTTVLWMALHPLECAVGLGFPIVIAFGRALDWRGLATRARGIAMTGAEPLLVGTLGTLALLDFSAATKGESARLWMGWFPLLLAGGVGVLATRERGWGWLVLGLAGTLVVLKGFYVFVWLYKLG